MSQTNGDFYVGPYMRHNIMYEVWFYDANDEISTNATAFTTNEPNIWGEWWKYLSLTIHTTQHCTKHGQWWIL